MSHRFRSLALLALALLAGCTDADPPPTTPPPTTPPPTTPPPPPPPPPPLACPAGELCLKTTPVVPGAVIPDGRLVVMFYQFLDEFDPLPDPKLMLDIPFSAASPNLQVKLADIALPSPVEPYELCFRDCFDLADPACACPAAEAKFVPAFVFVARDVDGSGAIELAELTDDNIYGVGVMHLGASDSEYPAQNALDILLPEGIKRDLSPYRIIENGIFDQLGFPAPGTVFDLDVCVPEDASCDQLRVPNLT